MAAVRKEVPYYVLKVLWEYSDPGHLVTLNRIREIVEEKTGIRVGRRAASGAIKMLRSFGFDIVFVKSADAQGYFLADNGRFFDESEVLYLCNTVHASHFMPTGESEAIISELLSTRSRYQRSDFRDNVHLPNCFKTNNKDLGKNYRCVFNAINSGKKIQFCYLQYGFDLVQHKKDNGRTYTAAPRYFVEHDSRPYVLVTHDDPDNLLTYRLDRMTEASLLNQKADPLSAAAKTDAYSVIRYRLFMFSGPEVSAVFRCKDKSLDMMIDLFGTDVRIANHVDGAFDLHVISPERGLILLAQQYQDLIYIKEPQYLRTEMRKILEESMKQYQD